MNLQGRELHRELQGDDVGVLQNELRTLGFVIAAEEIDRQFFGPTTVEAVIAFQEQQGLQPTGMVDERTAQAINEAVDCIAGEFFRVSGTVRSADGSVASGLLVEAFSIKLRDQELLGKAETNIHGGYEIAYRAAPFRSVDTEGPSLAVVVFSKRGERLGSSGVRFSSGAREVIDLTVDRVPDVSEYERLLDAITPAVGEIPIADLTDTQVDFLARSARVSANQLHFLIQAVRMATDTELISPAVFYGFLRLDQPTDLDSLLAEDISELRRVLLTAIEQRIIPPRIRDNLDEITARLEQLRIERGVIVPVSVSGRLLDKETEKPLPGLSIRVLKMADSGNPLPIEEIITDEDGSFAFSYFVIDPARADRRESSRTFRLSISQPGHDEFHAVDVTVDRDIKTLEVRIPHPPGAEPVSLAQLANRAALDLPDGLLSELEAQSIVTIEDLRAAGPLDRIVNLPDVQDEGVRKLEAHIRLSTLSQDIESNDALINAGYSSVATIGHAPRLEFAHAASTALGDFGAVKTQNQARVLAGLADLVVAAGRVVAWDPYAGTPADDGDDRLIDDSLMDEIADLFPNTCSCGACSNASSPLAYLADLIDYAQHNLKHFEEGATIPSPVTVANLENRFHQTLGELPVSCDQVSQQVNQVRICIEVLRRFLSDAGLPAAGTLEEEQLRRALKQYLERVYTTLLSGIGSSYDEIRTAHSAESETREALADRLGIVLEPDRPDLLDRLFLPPESLNEGTLERLFGLMDTTRDPLQPASTPEFLEGRLAFLLAAWKEQDEAAKQPLIDPDLIGPGYLKEPVPGNSAYDLWQARFDEVREQVGSLNEARNIASSDLAWFDESVQEVLRVSGEDLFGLEDRLNGGESIDTDLATLNLAFDAFTRLVRLRHVLVGNDPILDNEADDVVSILVQVHKRGQFASWQQDERDAGIVLSPDHFVIPEPSLDFPLPAPQPLPEWRATQDELRVWGNVLRTRIEEKASAVEVLQAAVRKAEVEALPLLRDGLIAASGQAARELTIQLLIDCEADGCQHTTRVAQAIQTLQGILWSTRTGQLSEAHPDLDLVDDHFDAAWRWLGSYETWRGALSVFLYPENVLLPSLRPHKTPTFERLVDQTRARRRIHPDDARRLARAYEDYFLDVASLSLGASCVAATRIYSGDRRGRSGREVRDLLYLFAKAEATQTVYWSRFDPDDDSAYAQTFWKKVPGLENVSRIIGAVPFHVSSEDRFIYLFVIQERTNRPRLSYTRFHLERGDFEWEEEPETIPLLFLAEERMTAFAAAVRQTNSAQTPPELAVTFTLDGKSTILFTGQLANPASTIVRESFNWQNVVLEGVVGKQGNAGQSFQSLLGMVAWREGESLARTESLLFVLNDRNDLIPLHLASGIKSGENDLSGFATPLALLSSASSRFESWLGAIRWAVEENLVYVLFKEGGHVYYTAIWGDTLPVKEPRRFHAASFQDISFVAPHCGNRFDQGDPLEMVYQRMGNRGGLFRGSVERVNAQGGIAFALRSSPTGPLGLRSRLDIGLFGEGDLLFDPVFEGPFEPEPIPPPPPPPPTPDPPAPDLLQLSESSRTRIAPQVARPLELVERLTENELQVRRSVMAGTFADNEPAPPSILTYLEEAYYFVPVHLALQLQRGDHFVESLDWFRTVYDYSADPRRRKIYHGLRMEESLTNTFQRLMDWLQDPLTPHTIARTRRNAYTRFSLLSIIQCLLRYADREFTRDTAESVARARTLYLTALDLLGPPAQQSDVCEARIVDLDRDLQASIGADDSIWHPVWDLLKADLRRIEDADVLRSTVDTITTVMEDTASLPERLSMVRKVVREAGERARATPTLGEVIAESAERSGRLHALLQKDSRFLAGQATLAEAAGRDLTRTVASITGISSDRLEQDKAVELPWVRQRLADDGHAVGSRPVADELAEVLPLVNSEQRHGKAYLPQLSSGFCVPVNPVLASIRLHAELNLYKIRTCRNIAGDERDLAPYALVEKGEDNVAAIGTDAQISLPLTRTSNPTPYRYATLIERAKQLVSLAQQIEAAFLAAVEKLDAEELNLLRARQENELSQAGVQLQTLRLRDAENGVILAELQRDRAQIQVDHFRGLLVGGLLDFERKALDGLRTSSGLQTLTGVLMIQAAAVTAFASGGSAAFPLLSSGLSSFFGAQSSDIQRLNIESSFERRQQDWQLAFNLARQDVLIGQQQARMARDQVRVVAHEREMAFLRTSHAQETLEFLANKFANAELYDYMSEVLKGIYQFFLQLATATAQLAANQLAFERQQALPAVIQSDYWDVPSEGFDTGFDAQNNSPDRRGITGSARLLQDIFRLDQFAFETDQRKLQLTKTFSLARLSPAEFQLFRESGVLRFNTPMEMFDRDFPGHYLRLIKSIRSSVIALIPPTEGIKATLAATGISRVVIESGGAFQTTEVRRPPESPALSSPSNATGLFELAPQTGEMLFPFEGMGVDTAWEFQMPKAANQFEYRTIADVLLTMEYTALDSPTYRRQVIEELDGSVSADRPFSFRQEFADQWYDLNHPNLVDPAFGTPMVVEITTRREDFPPNIDELRVQQLVLFFARKDGSAFEVTAGLVFTPAGGSPVGGSATSIDGITSTRRGNASSWNSMIGRAPVGTWKLDLTANLSDGRPVTEAIRKEDIEDILFVITYQGRTPAWPA